MSERRLSYNAICLTFLFLWCSLPEVEAGWSEPFQIQSDAWEISACQDSTGAIRVCFVNDGGLQFGSYLNGAITNKITLSEEDAQQPCILANGTALLVAFIVEAEDFNTTIEVMGFNGSGWGAPHTVLSGATLLEPTLALFNGLYYLAYAQSGADEDSVGLSNDVSITTSPDGLNWSTPIVIAGSVGNEGAPSLAVCEGRLYIAFMRSGEDIGVVAGQPSTELYLASSANGASWSAAERVTFDSADSLSPQLFTYNGRLNVVWSSNIDDDGFDINTDILCAERIDGEWTAPVVIADIEGDNFDPVVVPGSRFFCFWENGGNIECSEVFLAEMGFPAAAPMLALDTQHWTMQLPDAEQALQREFILSNTGNVLLEGHVETPCREEDLTISSSICEYALQPGESLPFTLYLDVDEPGNYSETVWVKCSNAAGLDLPMTIEVNVPQIQSGLDFKSHRATTPEKDALMGMAVVGAILFLAIIAAVLFRRGTKGAVAVFFTALMCLTAFSSVFPEAQASGGAGLLDAKIVAMPSDRMNISADFQLSTPISMHCPNTDPKTGMPDGYDEVVQEMDNITFPIHGIYFTAGMIGRGEVPFSVTVLDDSSRIIYSGSPNLTHESGQRFIDFGRSVETPSITVEFSTEGTPPSNTSGSVILGMLRGSDPPTQVTAFGLKSGNLTRLQQYNDRTAAIGVAFVRTQVRASSLTINNRIITLNANTGKLGGNLTLTYNVSHDTEARLKMVYYDLYRSEHPFIDTTVPLASINDSITVSFLNEKAIEFEEGKHYLVCGVYYGGGLVDRFGDGKEELPSSTFIAAAPRIMGASVDPTDMVQLDGKLNFTVIDIDGVPKEIDQDKLDQIRQKVINLCTDNSLGFEFSYIHTLPALKSFIENATDRSVVINTHGSVLPMPDEYFTEYAALDDTKLLLHCNDRGYLDSSSTGNLISRRTVQPPVQWTYNEFRITDPWGANKVDSASAAYCYPRLNGSIAYLPAADWKKDVSTVDISFKLNSLPKPNARAVLFSFWDALNNTETGFSLNLWKDPANMKSGLYLEWRCIQSTGNVQSCLYQIDGNLGLGKELWLRVARPYFLYKIPFGKIATYMVKLTEFSSPQKDTTSVDRLAPPLGNPSSWMNDIRFCGNPVAIAGNLPDGSAPLDVVLNRIDFYHSYAPGYSSSSVKVHSWEFGMTLPNEDRIPHYKKEGTVNNKGYLSYSSKKDAGDTGSIEPIETRLIPALTNSFLPRFGNAYNFDGQCWLEAKGSDQIRLQEFTLEMYARPDRSPDPGKVWTLVSDKGADGLTGLDICIKGELNGANSVEFSIGNKSSQQRYTISYGNASASALAPGLWHKIAAMYDGANLSLRIDGDQVASLFVNRSIDHASCPLSIGGRQAQGLYQGALDEVILSKGAFKANHNHQYEKWLTNISAWMANTKSVWLNPCGIPFGYLWNGGDTVYVGSAAIDGLMAPVYGEVGDFHRNSSSAKLLDYAARMLKGDQYKSLSLPSVLDYSAAASLSSRGSIDPLYADEGGDAIPAGFIRFGLGGLAFSTVYSPDIAVLLSVLRMPTDYTLNTFASEHYKGETISVRVKLNNPGIDVEEYCVNLTAVDPFGTEIRVDSRNVTLKPDKWSDMVLMFRLDNKSYPKGTYRLLVSVCLPDSDLLVDVWGDTEDEMADLTMSVIDNVRLDVLPHHLQTSNSDILEIPVRVTNYGGMTSRTVLKATFLATTGSLYNMDVKQNITVGPKMSTDFLVVFDPGEMLKDQIEQGELAQVPFGMYKTVLALYDYNSLRHASDETPSGGENETYLYDMAAFDHDVGREAGADWTAEKEKDRAGYICQGPYELAPSDDKTMVATYRLRINDITGQNDRVATVDVFDRTANRSLSSSDIYRQDFEAPSAYQDFQISYDTTGIGGDILEYRTFWFGNSQLWEAHVAVSEYVEKDETSEHVEVKTRPLDIGISCFEMLAKTNISMSNAGVNNLLVTYAVAGRSGSMTVSAGGKDSGLSLLHYPSEIIELQASCGKPSKDRLYLKVTRSVETFLVLKKQTKVLDVEHALAMRPADVNMSDRQSLLRIKDTLTMEDLSVRDYATGVMAGYDDLNRKPYIQMTKKGDEHWVEFDLKIAANGWYRISLEGFAFKDHVVVMKATVKSIPIYAGQKTNQVNLTFVFDQQDDSWIVNSTEIQLTSGSYIVRLWNYGAYESRIYPDVPATLLPTHDFGTSAQPGKDLDSKIVTLTILGFMVPFDSSWIPKIPGIPKIDLTYGMDLFGVFHLSLHDLNGSEVAKIETGKDYYLRIALSIPITWGKSENRTHQGLSYKDVSDKHKQISATVKVALNLKFEEILDEASGRVYVKVKSVEFYQFSLAILIPLKVWSNPGEFLVDLVSGGAGSEALGFILGPMWKGLNFLSKCLGGLEIDVGAGLYLGIVFEMTFKDGKKVDKIKIDVYPMGSIWCSIKFKILWFIKITILALDVKLIPVALELVLDVLGGWGLYIVFYLEYSVSIVLFQIELIPNKWKTKRFDLTPKIWIYKP
jgi:hypothetical protein